MIVIVVPSVIPVHAMELDDMANYCQMHGEGVIYNSYAHKYECSSQPQDENQSDGGYE